MHKAAFHGREQAMRSLIDNKGDVNTKDKRGITPLHISVHKNQVGCIDILLENGGDVAAADKFGWTPLHFAAYKNRLTLCETLIETKADVNVKDKLGNSPLAIALARGFASCASLLFDAGG